MKFAMHKYINTMNMSKKCQPNCRFQYPKPSMKYTKLLLPLNEEHCISEKLWNNSSTFKETYWYGIKFLNYIWFFQIWK